MFIELLKLLFSQLVAVSEVLKDEDKRKRYKTRHLDIVCWSYNQSQILKEIDENLVQTLHNYFNLVIDCPQILYFVLSSSRSQT